MEEVPDNCTKTASFISHKTIHSSIGFSIFQIFTGNFGTRMIKVADNSRKSTINGMHEHSFAPIFLFTNGGKVSSELSKTVQQLLTSACKRHYKTLFASDAFFIGLTAVK